MALGRRGSAMQVRLVGFGEIEVEGRRYPHDVVIEGGDVRKRRKGPSKSFRDRYGHTPLSADEEIPWRGHTLVVGTGAGGRLPVMPEVLAEARRRGIRLIAVPTEEACRLLHDERTADVNAILHVTC
jgi:hypothetical protein